MDKLLGNVFNMQAKADFVRDANKKSQVPRTERYIKAVSNKVAVPLALVVLGLGLFITKGADLLIPSLNRPAPKEKGPGGGFKQQGEKKNSYSEIC